MKMELGKLLRNLMQYKQIQILIFLKIELTGTTWERRNQKLRTSREGGELMLGNTEKDLSKEVVCRINKVYAKN